MPRRRYVALRLLPFLLVAAVAVLWRLPHTTSEWRLVFCENDSLYQLYRVQQSLEHYPFVRAFDPYAHFPPGYRVVWLNPHTFFYATVARLAGASAGSLEGLARVVSWIPPAFGVLAIVLALAIVRSCTTDWLCVMAVGMLCALSAEVSRPFLFGIIDHHLFAHLGVLLLVLGRLRRQRGWWLLGLVALLAMTPESIIYVSVVLICLLLSDLLPCVLALPRRAALPWFWYASPAVVALLALAAHRRLSLDPLPLSDVTWMYPTLFQVAWLALLGIGCRAVLALDAVSARRSSLPALAAGMAALGVAGVVFLSAVGALGVITQRLMVANRMFVGEEAFVFQAGFWSVPAAYRILALSGLYFVVKLIDGVRLRADSDYWFQWIMFSVALALGFKEFRHLYVLSSLQLIGFALAAFGTGRALRRLPLFSGGAGRVAPAALLLAGTVPFLLLTDVQNRRALGTVCDALPLTEELSGWLLHHTPDPRPTPDDRPAYGVFGSWSIGHQLHILGQRPVVVDPFNYELNNAVEDAAEEVWSATTAGQLMQALARYDVRYLVLTNPGEDIVGVGRRRNRPIPDFVALPTAGQVVFRPAMTQFATFRLFMASGLSGEFGNLQPRFFSTETETYTSSSGAHASIPAGQVYEIKPGAVITARVEPGDGDVEVHCTLQRGTQVFDLGLPIAVGADGRVRFHTALPAPVEETSFRVTGGYRFTAGHRTASLQVTQAMIDSGATVELQWTGNNGG